MEVEECLWLEGRYSHLPVPHNCCIFNPKVLAMQGILGKVQVTFIFFLLRIVQYSTLKPCDPHSTNSP